ncbi:PaaI family thioesterase [Actinoplanes sp. L3-i22]|uniref:PaaI family thioesterase n=1 Tax=Actinoplanes sp. L3-i22 TaxID=2836373 RepID=UPI001C748D2B|nr:PaaI family thioesterase [Actinoplanes sp. L3-i22]BCY13715.1 thioesterase [Actinoplanes sp. L3-i22]
MTQTQARERTFTWTDPAEHAKLFVERSGLDVLRAMAAGEIPPPPIMQLISGDRLQVEPGSVTITLTPQEFHYNPIGTVHGGVIATLLDTAAACSVQTTLPAGIGYTSMDLNVKFLRPVTIDTGLITCTGTVLQQGRRTALAEARLTDARGKLIAHATSTCLIFELPTA